MRPEMGSTVKNKKTHSKNDNNLQKPMLTDTEKLLIDALSCALRDKTVSRKKISDEELLKLYALAQRQKVLPLVVNSIYGCPGVESSSVLPDMKKKVVYSVVLQMRREAALKKLYAAMIDAGYKPIIFKGIACREVYSHGEYRLSCDEDILVDPSQHRSAGEFIGSQGFERYDPKENEDANFVITWTDKESGLNIELHRSLFEEASDAVGGMCTFFENVNESCEKYRCRDGFEYYSLNPHDHMLLLILHAYKHFIHSGFGLRQICDIGMWAGKYSERINWDLLYKQCSSVHAAPFASAVLKIAGEWLNIDIDIPTRWNCEKINEMPMLKDLLSGGIYGATNSTRLHSGTIMFKMVEANRRSEKRSFMRTVFPKLAYMKQKYPVLEKYPVLLPVMWCARITTTFTGGSSASETLNITNERKKLMKEYGIID